MLGLDEAMVEAIVADLNRFSYQLKPSDYT